MFNRASCAKVRSTSLRSASLRSSEIVSPAESEPATTGALRDSGFAARRRGEAETEIVSTTQAAAARSMRVVAVVRDMTRRG